MSTAATIDEYLETFPDKTAQILTQVRDTVKAAAPNATECINYGIPTLQLDGKNLVHYGGFEKHIGFYATPDGHAEFEAELSKYKRGKGSVQFPLDQPIPLDLIQRIVRFRAHELTS